MSQNALGISLPLKPHLAAVALARAATQVNPKSQAICQVTALAKPSAIHTAADHHAKRIFTSVRYAFAKGRGAVNRATLSQARTAKQAATALAPAAPAVYTALVATLPSVLRAALVAGGEVGADGLRGRQLKAAELTTLAAFSFNAKHKNLDIWVASRVATLATQLTDTTKKNIASAIARTYADGPRTLAKWSDDLLAAVGDVERAQRIADYEGMKATNQGVLQSFKQAAEDGYLTGKETKTWATADSKACDECDELDGEEVLIDDDFSNGDDAPPAHISCRCFITTSV